MDAQDLPQSDEPFVPVPPGEGPSPEDLPSPVRVAATIVASIDDDAGWSTALDMLVAPDARAYWTEHRAAISGLMENLSLGTGVEYPAPDIAYVRFVSGLQGTQLAQADVLVSGQVMTLQRRPELGTHLGGWRAHSFGDYVLPEQLP